MSEEQPLTSVELVELDITDVGSRDEAIDRLLQVVQRAGRLSDADVARSDVVAREEAGSTALPGGVAIPHARTAGVSSRTVAALRLSSPVEWSPGAAPVDLVLGLLCPGDDRDGYLALLAAVARGVTGRLPRQLRAAQRAEDAVGPLEQAATRT